MNNNVVTPQQYYDILCTAAKDGTFPSYSNGMCMYRTPEGKRCAVGILASEEQYNRARSYGSVEGSLPYHFLKNCQIEIDLSIYNCLRAIQDAHDIRARRWNTASFIAKIGDISCFKDVIKKEIYEN